LKKENDPSSKQVLKLVKQLDKDLQKALLSGIVTSTYVEKSNFKGKFLQIFQSFIPVAFENLVIQVRKNIFVGSISEAERKSYNKALTAHRELTQKHNDLIKKMVPGSDENLMEEAQELQAELEELESKFDFNKIESRAAKASKTRKNMEAIGGQPIRIFDKKSNSELDGMYLSADKFKSVLKQSGAEIATLTVGNHTIQAFAFPKEIEGSSLHKTLALLGMESTGFEFYQLGDSIYLLTTEDIALLQAQEDQPLNVVKNEITEHPSNGGTVLLTSGNIGVYEMHKKEMLAYLMKGMDVMAFNFAGYGESKGNPSEKTLKSNMEAAYHHLQQHHPIPDNKILLKALCISGGPATHLAALHPTVNLFLDQSYANFKWIVADAIKEEIEAFTGNMGAKAEESASLKKQFYLWADKMNASLAHGVAHMIAPAWETSKDIQKVEGKVGILLTKNDTLMKMDREVRKNYEAMRDAGKAEQVSVMAMEGKHSTSWLNSKEVIGYAYDASKVSSITTKYQDMLENDLNDLQEGEEPLAQDILDLFHRAEEFYFKSPNEVLIGLKQMNLDLEDPEDAPKINQLILDISNTWFPDNEIAEQNAHEYLNEAYSAIFANTGKVAMDHFLNKSDLMGDLYH